MKTCSYCGRQNDDTAIVCSECGTGRASLPAPEVDPQLSDPAGALVLIASFDTMAQASLLLTRLEAAGIEACIPEEYASQLSSTVIPLGCVTVRVAARDIVAAQAIAVGLAEPERSSAAAEGALKVAAGTVGQIKRSRPAVLTRQAVGVITAIVVVMPMLFGVIAHLIRDSAAMGPLFWLWALFSVACLFWARYVFRRYRPLALGCMAIDMLQLVSFLVLFMSIDLPANSRSVPFTPPPTRNPHNW